MTQSPAPYQGAPQPQYQPPPPEKKPLSRGKRVLIAAGIATAFFLWVGACGAFLRSNEDPKLVITPSPTVTVTATTSSVPAPTTPVVKKPEPPAAKPTPTEKPMTRAQEQAIGAAEDYLDTSNFSKKGLIEQLEYEGHSKKDATFAVDHIEVNWNEQAAGAAEDYLDTSHFSRKGLIDQLKYEGYTQSQAEYGVEKAGL